ncbi:MAG: hypothetical protein PHE43_01245 [Candidatus Nanoarchaeia archaeon]|nr:hypothetical protein [Candidatus Nanoarchaeia archaeon]
MDIWFRELGFWNNPFSIKPGAFDNEIYGYDIDLILSKIENGEVLFIEGGYGRGKTSILKRIIERFGGEKKLIYYSCNRTESSIDVDSLIKGRTFWTKLFGMMDDNLILLLDEVQDLGDTDARIIKDYFGNHFKSIIFVSSDIKAIKVDGIKDLVGDNIIKLGRLDDNIAIDIVRKRIGSLDIISNDMIKELFKMSEYNPRTLLQNCEAVCKVAVKKGDLKVTKEHIKEVFG